MSLIRKIARILRTEGLSGVAARLRRRWRLVTFRPHFLAKEVDGCRFEFYVGTREGQEWYGRFVDSRLYKPIEPELEKLATMARPGDIVADVGAHHGYFALLLSQWVGPRGKVVAFECLPANAAIAERNMALNHVGNVRVIRSAVGDHSGTVQIGDTSGGVLVDRSTVSRLMTVDMVTLDSVFADATPDLLKIDVEGFELEVLRGARRCLAARPKLALEFHCFKFADPVAHVGEILRLLPKDGYHYALAPEAGDDLVDYRITSESAAFIGARYNPHLYGIPVSM